MAARGSAAEGVRQHDAENHDRPKQDTKSERLGARLTPRQKDLLQRAADLTGRSLTDFIVSSAMDRAEDTIRTYEVMELSERDAVAFYRALQNPPRLSGKLYESMRRHIEKVEMR